MPEERSRATAGFTARVEPAGLDIEVRDSETLFDAAYREGYDWPTICAGQAQCTHCHVRILEGVENVPPVTMEKESRAIRRLAGRLYGDDPHGIRLACQLELEGDIVVQQDVFAGERLDER